ncbi:aminotransferase class I/II-fold pyridoxal phosphate-dependent enzyme, partial [Lysinibacillus irui]|uniref:pyridoxal phosphate-dependent aminotransferase n=1 Tax=Lysinibacillus irui TaxID=2998077 RepID=UPI003D2B274A
NPTGVVIPDAQLRAFLAKVPSDVLVVLDEAYIEYVTHPDHKDTLPIIDEYPNVLLLRTFSKAYGLASFRVGYAIGQPDIIAKLDPVRSPFNNTILSQAVAAIALSDQDYIEACRKAMKSVKKQYVEFCEKHNLTYYPSDTNFIFFDTTC